MNIFSKLINKKVNCLLITPPLFAPWSFYVAAPLLTGQLLDNGFSAINLDLNIKFFRTVLSQNYIEQTRKILDSKGISYDNENVDFMLKNVDSAILTYNTTQHDDQTFKEAQSVLQSVLDFISLPFSSSIYLHINSQASSLSLDYEWVKKVSCDPEHNIFIDFFEETINEIREKNIDLVGITVPFPDTIIPAFTLARLLKEKTNAHVAIGGVFIKGDTILNHPDVLDIYCDSVLIDDGEESIVELAKFIKNRKKREKISGLICKNKKNEVVFNPPKQIKTMKNIADISLDGLDLNEYMAGKPSSVPLIISKGCYWGKCRFCDCATKYNYYCIKSPEKVVANIKYIYEKYQVSVFRFQDDAIPPLYLGRLADEIIKQGLKIQYHCYARLEKEFDRGLLAKLYESGLRCVFWGLESGSQRVLDAMNKGIKIENVHQILKDSHELGIHNIVGIITNYPTETIEEYRETFEFMKTIEEYMVMIHSDFSLKANSIIARNCEQFGVKILQDYYDFGYYLAFQDINMTDTVKQQKYQVFSEYFKDYYSA